MVRTTKPRPRPTPEGKEASASDDRFALVELGGVLGKAIVVTSPRGLVALRAFNDVPTALELSAWLASVDAAGATEGVVDASVVDALRRYAAGEPIELTTLSVDLRGPPFHQRVYRALRSVPRGAVRSYQGLASDAGSPRAMRAVGQAMAKNPLPIVVPCHRVVGAGGALGGYTGGVDRKRALLELEGVSVHGDRVLVGQLELL